MIPNQFLTRVGMQTALALCFVLLCSATGASRSAGGSITGVVKDPNGAVVKGVTITVSCDCKAAECKLLLCNECCPQKTVTTDDSGEFRITDLRSGTYSLKAESGSEKGQVDSIKVTDGSDQRLEIKLSRDS